MSDPAQASLLPHRKHVTTSKQLCLDQSMESDKQADRQTYLPMKSVVARYDLGVGQHAIHAEGALGVAAAFHIRLQQQTRTFRLGVGGTSLVA
jgi:hypothetical protein